ncbi:uncharacterized protein LOC135386041 [Ornithodoros turicata]|uniref:uncharacterized protein LOC135386041 n=1 Tax=Ornithodoros turicata TaxID=34597 RepID=UPI00313899CE
MAARAKDVVPLADSDNVQLNRVIATLLCLHLKRHAQHRRLRLAIRERTRAVRSIELRLHANAIAMTAVLLGGVQRERWAFQRNERWFEDTLPHLGEFHFKQALRVCPVTFRYLVESCRHVLEHQTTNMRQPISVEKRVAIGLYRLCSTAEDRTIAHFFGVGRSTVNVVYRQFAKAVIQELEDEWLRMVSPGEMGEHMREFYAVSGFPQGVGALDGCHFAVSPPKNNAVDYYNYKGWYSVILLALVDHRYRFRYINVGSPGRCHDAHVYGRSKLCELVNSAHFQTPVSVIEDVPVSPIILCDQAFPLSPSLMKPYANAVSETPEALFNYNLSKTRRIVENAFGRLKARFRFIMKRLECTLPNAKQAVRTSCILHNICEAFNDNVEHQWERDAHEYDALYEQPRHSSDMCHHGGQEVRRALTQYFWKRRQQTS